ncbi:MAG: hypothetical protein FWE52_01505 [Alphaproteobacteria bacterium]|nr:hypothetical protein [Alphaproteobacteria bacterium]
MKQQKDDQDALLIQQNKIMNAQEDIAYRQYLLQRANKLFEVDDMTKEIFNASIDFHKTIVSTTQININIEFLKLWPKVASYAGKLRVFYPVNESLDSITELYNKALEEIEVTKGSKRFNTENREHWQNFYEKYVSAAADKLTNIIEDISEELIKIGIELKNLEKNYIKGAG